MRSINSRFPQNFIIRKPLPGAGILFVFVLSFALLYRPLDFHASQHFSYEVTMLLYSLSAAISAWITIFFIKRISYFSNTRPWTLMKELISIYLVLQIMGITVFLMAFALEAPPVKSRWNFTTFIDSCLHTFMVGILPFAFYSIMGFRNRPGKIMPTVESEINEAKEEQKVHINSSLKKESLSFLPGEFLYAESDGNYVIFYFNRDHKSWKSSIRNSISNIEKQLSPYPGFLRCHRAFIVNMDKVKTRKGNAAGYQLSLFGTDSRVPVSRQKVNEFDRKFKRPASLL